MAPSLDSHLQASFHPLPADMPTSTIIIASLIGVYLIVFWVLTLAYVVTYVNRRKSLAVSSRSVDVLVWELVIIALTAATIGSREISRSAFPGHGVPAFIGRFGFFLYSIMINIVHCQRMGIVIGHFDDEWRQTSSWVKHCSTAAQRFRVLAWGLVATIGVTLVFSGNRGGCVHDICRVHDNLVYGADQLVLLASVALAGYPIETMRSRLLSVNAKDEVTGLYNELHLRGNTNGAAWVALQTLLMLLDFRVINGPAWESVVNIGALIYPTGALITNHITPSLRLGFAPTADDLILCCFPTRVSAPILGTQRVTPIGDPGEEEGELDMDMDMEREIDEYLLMVAEEDGTEEDSEPEDTQVPRPPPPASASRHSSLEYPVITADVQVDAAQRGIPPPPPPDAYAGDPASLNFRVDARSSRLRLEPLVSHTSSEALAKADAALSTDGLLGAQQTFPNPAQPSDAGADPQAPARPRVDTTQAAGRGTEASPGGARQSFNTTGSLGTQRKPASPDGATGQGTGESLGTPSHSHSQTQTLTLTLTHGRRDLPGGLVTSPLNYRAVEEGTATGGATPGSMTPLGTGTYNMPSPTASSPSGQRDGRGSLRDSVTSWLAHTAETLRGSLTTAVSGHLSPANRNRDSITQTLNTLHARRESGNGGDRRSSSTSSTGAGGPPSATASAAAAMMVAPPTPRSYHTQKSLTPGSSRSSTRTSTTNYQDGPDRRTSVGSSQGDRRSSSSLSTTQRMGLTSRKSSKRLSVTSQTDRRKQRTPKQQRDIFQDILHLNDEERAELFVAARLALVENPTRFVLDICELRSMPLDKASRPAVRDKCTILASAYIGDWAPSRVDIGRDAEEAIQKEVKKLSRRAVLFEDDCKQAIAAFDPAFQSLKTQVGQVFQSYLSVVGTDTRRFPLDDITEDQGSAGHDSQNGRSNQSAPLSAWANVTSALWTSITSSKDPSISSVGEGRLKTLNNLGGGGRVRDRSTSSSSVRSTSSSSVSMGTMLSTAVVQEGTTNINNSLNPSTSKDNRQSSSSHKGSDHSAAVDPSTLPAAPSRLAYSTGWASFLSSSRSTSSAIAPAPPPPSPTRANGTDRSWHSAASVEGTV